MHGTHTNKSHSAQCTAHSYLQSSLIFFFVTMLPKRHGQSTLYTLKFIIIIIGLHKQIQHFSCKPHLVLNLPELHQASHRQAALYLTHVRLLCVVGFCQTQLRCFYKLLNLFTFNQNNNTEERLRWAYRMERALETSSGATEGSNVSCTARYNRNMKKGGVLHRRRSFPCWDFGHLRDYLFRKTTQIFLKVSCIWQGLSLLLNKAILLCIATK